MHKRSSTSSYSSRTTTTPSLQPDVAEFITPALLQNATIRDYLLDNGFTTAEAFGQLADEDIEGCVSGKGWWIQLKAARDRCLEAHPPKPPKRKPAQTSLKYPPTKRVATCPTTTATTATASSTSTTPPASPALYNFEGVLKRTPTRCSNCHVFKIRAAKSARAHECSIDDKCIDFATCPTQYSKGHPEVAKQRSTEQKLQRQALRDKSRKSAQKQKE
jgi:hypothetical protein